ncbi:tetratricopeptide repeat protein [Candidatus Microgenomates bacterium]|nr:tetratricopeptide repeat protein [Candidatus Microgenomates bacterium]
MTGLIVVALAVIASWLSIHYFHRYQKEDISSPKTSARLNRLWEYVNKAFQSRRWRASERALLAILRIDHKNTAAYNRLGMLYAKQSNFDDAIDCFSIASSLTPTLATLYNLGLVQYEKGNFKEAANALERVIDLEPNVKRYIAYAKALHKLESDKKVAEVLEKVVELEPTAVHYDMLAQVYENIKQHKKAEEARRLATSLRTRRLLGRRRGSKSARLATRRIG